MTECGCVSTGESLNGVFHLFVSVINLLLQLLWKHTDAALTRLWQSGHDDRSTTYYVLQRRSSVPPPPPLPLGPNAHLRLFP